MKKKLLLTDLKVTSFITELSTDHKLTAKGGDLIGAIYTTTPDLTYYASNCGGKGYCNPDVKTAQTTCGDWSNPYWCTDINCR